MPADASTITWVIVSIIYAIDLVVRIWLLVYIPKNRKPTAAMSWLLLIYIIPLFGTILFFIIGGTKLSKRRRHSQQQITAMIRRYTNNLEKTHLIAQIEEPYRYKAKLAEALTGLAPTK